MNDVAVSSSAVNANAYSGADASALGTLDAPESVPLLTVYLRILSRHRWLIAAVTGVFLVLGLILTLLTTPEYTAQTTIEISREDAKVVNVQGVVPERQGLDLEFYQTQYGLLASKSLAEQVASDLRLVDDVTFFDMFRQKRTRYFGSAGNDVSDPVLKKLRLRRAGEILLDNVAISPSRGSSLVNISFTSPNAELSAKVTNAWAKGFIRSNLERRFDATSYARTFLEGRLEQVRSRLESSERALVAYATNQRIISIPTSTDGGANVEHPIVAADLAAINTALAAATAARIQAEARWNSSKGGDAGAIPEALENTAIASLRRDRATAAGDYQLMMQRYEPQYPAAKALTARIQTLDAAIAREEGRVRSSLQRGYIEAVARERDLKAQVDRLEVSLLDTKRRSIQYNIFQRDVDTNRELYNGLLQRYKEIGVAGGVGTNNISVVDDADVPQRPSKPNLLRNLLLALLAGAAAGVGLALAREQIDDGIGDPADVQRLLGLPLLGVVPREKDIDLIPALLDPKSSAREAYLAIQTNLEFATQHGAPSSIAVTSTGSAEGKSTTSYALALLLARSGRRVVLVDADMRSPSVHALSGISNAKGLSNFLSGSDEIDKLIVSRGGNEMALLPAGPQPPNAAELLMGDRFKLLLEKLLDHFDQVVVDSPPVMGLADAPLIASRVEGLVFAVQSNSRGSRVIRRALTRLAGAHAHVLGVVITKFDAGKLGFGYGHDEAYGYGYGRPVDLEK